MDIKAATKVYIIESPHPEDLKIGRVEGLALGQILKLAGIDFSYYEAGSTKEVQEKFKQMANEINQTKDDKHWTIIHFSMHGNEKGIGLTSGEFIDWEKFSQLLVDFISDVGTFPIPNTTGNRLCPLQLGFSVCKGISAKEIKQFIGISPYWTLVGPNDKVSWSDSLMAFSTLYHNLILKRTSFEDAVKRMNMASGLDNVFEVDLAVGFRLL